MLGLHSLIHYNVMSSMTISDRPMRWSSELQVYSLQYSAIAPQTRYNEAHFRQMR